MKAAASETTSIFGAFLNSLEYIPMPSAVSFPSHFKGHEAVFAEHLFRSSPTSPGKQTTKNSAEFINTLPEHFSKIKGQIGKLAASRNVALGYFL